MKTVKSAVVPRQLCWLWFLWWLKLLGLSAELVNGNCGCSHCMVVPALPPCSCLYTSQLCWSLGRVKLKLCVMSWKAGEAGYSLHPPFPRPSGKLFLAGKFLLLNSAGLGDGWYRQNEAVLPSLFLRLFSGVLFHCFAEVLKWITEFSLSCLCLWIANCSFSGAWRLDSSTFPSWWHHSPNVWCYKTKFVIKYNTAW